MDNRLLRIFLDDLNHVTDPKLPAWLVDGANYCARTLAKERGLEGCLCLKPEPTPLEEAFVSHRSGSRSWLPGDCKTCGLPWKKDEWCELEAKRVLPVAEVHDEPVCDTMDCFRPPVRQVDVFGEPGGPGVSAFVCEECAQEHERHKAGLDEAQKRINERRISEPPKKGRKKR